MNSLTARHGLTKIKLALAAAALACLAFAFTANQAHAANAGDAFEVDFNYAGLATGALGQSIDSLVLKPGDKDAENNPLGALELRGTYTDGAGNFKLPKATGLTFPKIGVDIKGAAINGEIGLLEDGSGNYNSATGEMTLNVKISLTLGVDDIKALGNELNFDIPGTGALTCDIGPLDLAMGTGVGWPHAGSPFANTADIEDGAIAGYWDHKPDAISADPAKQYLCNLIGGLLDPVGGLWLANAADGIYNDDNDMPAATQAKPAAKVCEAPLVGEYPDCAEPNTPVDPKASFSALKLMPKKKTLKAGKKLKLKVRVTNDGDGDGKVTVKLNVNKKRGVKLARKVTVTVPAGKTVTRAVVLKTTKKAKGKYRVTAKAAGKKANSVITVKKAKKGKKKRK